MKNFPTLLIAFFSVVFIAACAFKVPELTDPGKGLLAFPTVVVNSSQFSGIACDHVLTSNLDDIKLMVRSHVGKRLYYTDQLVPGNYCFNQVKSILSHQEFHSSSHTYTRHLGGNAITISIEAGKITVPKYKIVVEQNPGNDIESVVVHFHIERIDDSERNDFIDRYLPLDEQSKWQVRE